jgi:D-alanine-D-alanine ligase
MKKNIAIIFGGHSSEHEVSINSARNIFKALDKTKFSAVLIGISKQGTWYSVTENELESLEAMTDKNMSTEKAVTLIRAHSKVYSLSLHNHNRTEIDCAFGIVHGTNGEDGTMQGYFKILGLPFVGCGVMSSAIAMDKEAMKIVMTAAGIPNSRYAVLHSYETPDFDKIAKQLGLPFFIKPANAGSSVGVHKIKSKDDFATKIKDAFKYDHKVIAEEFIEGREIEISVMGLNQKPEAAVPGELVVKHEFYSYEAKYLDPNGAEIVIPAKITSEQTESIRALAIKTYQALYCDGLTRVDFFMKKDGSLIVNEINTLPGFTKISMYPMMWQAKGIAYTDLISKLIQLAFDKNDFDNKLNLDFRS